MQSLALSRLKQWVLMKFGKQLPRRYKKHLKIVEWSTLLMRAMALFMDRRLTFIYEIQLVGLGSVEQYSLTC